MPRDPEPKLPAPPAPPPATSDRRLTDLADLVAVAAGGALGGVVRYAVAQAAPPHGELPWATLTVNVAGAFVVGLVVALVARGRAGGRLIRPFVVAGVCGGLTTFSTLVTEVVLFVRGGHLTLGLTYLGVSLAAGLGAAALGARWGRAARVAEGPVEAALADGT